MAGLSYMQRRASGIYEFRKRLPVVLAGKPAPEWMAKKFSELINPKTGCFKRELTVSLGTHDHKMAKRLDLKQAVRVEALFTAAAEAFEGRALGLGDAATRALHLPPEDEVEAHAIREVLLADDAMRFNGDGRTQVQTAEERAGSYPLLEPLRFGKPGMEPSHVIVAQEEILLLLQDFRDAIARYDTDIVRPEFSTYLASLGIEPQRADPEALHAAALAYLRGTVRGFEQRLERQAGKPIPTPKEPAPKSATCGPKVTEVFALWREGTPGKGGKKPSQMTVREAERAVRYFTDYHGDLHLGQITKEQTRDFRNALARLPTRLSHAQRKLSIRTILASAKPDQETVHAASVNKYLNLLVAIVSNAEREGRLDQVAGFVNPFAKLSLSIDKRNDPKRRMPFEEADLAKVFGSSVYSAGSRPLGGGGEAAYWLPLIALLSGARLNEIVQLRICDLKQDDETGIWLFDIDTEGGRSIKTVSSRRKVPVHAELIRLGLLVYREQVLKKAGGKATAWLWPEISSADEQYRATAWSKWFNRHLRKGVGITDSNLVFHSFRHTFKRLARDAGLQEDLHDALTGHVGNASIGRGYGAGFGLKALHKGIEQIEAPASVKALGRST